MMKQPRLCMERADKRLNLLSIWDPWEPWLREACVTETQTESWKRKCGIDNRLAWREFILSLPSILTYYNSLSLRKGSSHGAGGTRRWGIFFEGCEGNIWGFLFHLCGILIFVFSNKAFSFSTGSELGRIKSGCLLKVKYTELQISLPLSLLNMNK